MGPESENVEKVLVLPLLFEGSRLKGQGEPEGINRTNDRAQNGGFGWF